MAEPAEESDTSTQPTDPNVGMAVGVDGSPGSDAALTWASARVDRLGVIEPVSCWSYPVWAVAPAPFGSGSIPPAPAMDSSAYTAVTSSLEGYPAEHFAEPVIQQGTPTDVLLDRGEKAGLLVIGSQARSRLSRLLIGSVAMSCAYRTTTPLVVVPPGVDSETLQRHRPERIAVGVDGSDNSDSALRWALGYAEPADEITAYGTWHVPAGSGPEQVSSDERLGLSATERVIEEAIERAQAAVGSDHAVAVEAVAGDPRDILHDAGRSNDLLVVGTRGRTGLEHLVLGSTTSALLTRLDYPMVVVPHPVPDDESDD